MDIRGTSADDRGNWNLDLFLSWSLVVRTLRLPPDILSGRVTRLAPATSCAIERCLATRADELPCRLPRPHFTTRRIGFENRFVEVANTRRNWIAIAIHTGVGFVRILLSPM